MIDILMHVELYSVRNKTRKFSISWLGQEHWLGLDNIYKLTNRKHTKMQLKIDLEYHPGEIESVMYDDFYLEDQVNKATII